MKCLTIICILLSYSLYSQAVVPIYKNSRSAQDVYYKDTFNDFDKFTGTWKYTNGTTSLTITLQKKIKQEHTLNKFYYEDIVIGGYKYVENGVEKVNTLHLLMLNMPSNYDYPIVGTIIAGPGSIYCQGCGVSDRKLLLQFSEPNREVPGYEPEMIFQRADSGSVQKLKLKFRTISGRYDEEGVTPQYTSYSIPFGEYLLVKQP
ncbi:DUF6705 family protein [Flavobacterium psychrotrophum]|uniref:DUF6705 family protein n=1 Tax=Flavobacterium psychrotrophum TaxID=2294119 RepID=UPI000E31D7F1|nr:DUF6705 family protein [Flavobacterium psychrotrophum]